MLMTSRYFGQRLAKHLTAKVGETPEICCALMPQPGYRSKNKKAAVGATVILTATNPHSDRTVRVRQVRERTGPSRSVWW